MKRCSSCNRTYSDDTLTFCLADGTLLSAPYDSQATEILPTIPKTIPSPPPVWPRAKSVATKSQRKGSRLLYAIAALLLLIVGVAVTMWWKRRPNQGLQSGSTAAGPLTVTTPTPQTEQTEEALSKPSPSTPMSVPQQQSVVAQSPSATDTLGNGEVPVRFSLDHTSADHRDNAARLKFQGGQTPYSIGEGYVTNILVTTGTRWESGTILIMVKAPVKYPIAAAAGEPTTRTTEEEVSVESSVKGTITKILVRDGQRIHPDDLLLIIRKD